MSDAFYPPNRQVSIAANVYYFFNDGNEHQDLDLGSYDYAFRWSTSPVFGIIRPELLQYLSLFVYQGQTTTTKIVLDPLCEAMPLQTKLIDEETCSEEANTTNPLQILDKLTTHVSSKQCYLNHLTCIAYLLALLTFIIYNNSVLNNRCIINYHSLTKKSPVSNIRPSSINASISSKKRPPH